MGCNQVKLTRLVSKPDANRTQTGCNWHRTGTMTEQRRNSDRTELVCNKARNRKQPGQNRERTRMEHRWNGEKTKRNQDKTVIDQEQNRDGTGSEQE